MERIEKDVAARYKAHVVVKGLFRQEHDPICYVCNRHGRALAKLGRSASVQVLNNDDPSAWVTPEDLCQDRV